MLRYLSLDIVCSSKLTVFLELRSRKTVRFSEQITSADKYLSIFSRQMEAIVYLMQGGLRVRNTGLDRNGRYFSRENYGNVNSNLTLKKEDKKGLFIVVMHLASQS